MSSSYYGRSPTMTIYDESSHMSDAMAYTAGYGIPQQIPRPRVHAYDVHCTYCGVEPGRSCLKWVRKRRKKIRVDRPEPHPCRRHAAKLANQMLDAIKPPGVAYIALIA